MATGLTALGTLRGAIEAAEGDSTVPTRLLYIPPDSLSITPTLENIEDRREWAKGFDSMANVYPGMEDWTISITGVPMSFEDAGWWWCAWAKSGSAAGAVIDTSGYERTWTPSQTSSVVGAGVESLHLQYSSTDLIGTFGLSLPGLVGENLSLHFRKRASGTDTGLTMDMTFRTSKAAVPITAFTGGALSDRTQTFALGQQLKAYVDTTAGGLGGTGDTNITEFDLDINRPALFHDGMDGTGVHTSMHRGNAEITASFLRKFNDLIEYNAWKGATYAKTLRAIRVEATGAKVGAATALNTIRADFVGKAIDSGQFPERVDGMFYQRINLAGVYDATLGASAELYTLNSVSAAYDTA